MSSQALGQSWHGLVLRRIWPTDFEALVSAAIRAVQRYALLHRRVVQATKCPIMRVGNGFAGARSYHRARLAGMKEVSEAESVLATSASPDPKAPIPKQIRYIIGNEGCERFSFYGMRNILTVFLVSSLLLFLPESERAHGAKDVFHTFVIGVYFFPLLGGWLADRLFGKYNTILWLSLVYCVGQACLAMFVTNRTCFYIGLGLIALGSGGIKPCVAA